MHEVCALLDSRGKWSGVACAREDSGVTDVEAGPERLVILRGLWLERPPEFRKAENVADFHEEISREYANLLGGEGSREAFGKVLEGLVL